MRSSNHFSPPNRGIDAVSGAIIDGDFFDQLIAALHADLRRVARRERFRLGAGATLCTTALVNEAWLKLRSMDGCNDRVHFMRTAAMAMRQVIINDAQARCASKRNHGLAALPIDEVPEHEQPGDVVETDLLALDDALRTLEQLSPRLAQVVECRYFAGYSEAETALAMGVTDRTVRRDWVKARAWLHQQLRPIGGDERTPGMPHEP